MSDVWVLHCDGAARGNPGPGGLGVVIEGADGAILKEVGAPLGRVTNNVAEYSALVRGLEEARALGCARLQVYTDSELMERQVKGRYRVKSPDLLPLYTRAMTLIRQFENVTVTHVRRHLNRRADELANLGADKSSAA